MVKKGNSHITDLVSRCLQEQPQNSPRVDYLPFHFLLYRHDGHVGGGDQLYSIKKVDLLSIYHTNDS